MANSEEKTYTKEETLEIAKIYHEYVEGQKIAIGIEGGANKFYKKMLSKMKKYPAVFEDDIRCIENAINH